MKTAIKEKPILFSGPMVRAILDGRKTQTRRIVKPQPPECINDLHGGELRKRAPYTLEDNETGCIVGNGFFDDDIAYKCPYEVSQTLWVRETWSPDHKDFYPHHPIVYKADYPIDTVKCKTYSPEQKQWYPFRWRPSIHMPRSASRLSLTITDVRVEQVQDIRVGGLIAEGVDESQDKPFEWFAKLWDSLNAKRGFSWASNPFVWVIDFEVIK